MARLEYAVTRIESAAMLALTIVSAPAAYFLAGVLMLPDGLWIAVLLFGLAATTVLVLSSLSDPTAGADHVRYILAAHYGILGVRDEGLKEQVGRAIEYRARMENLTRDRKQAWRGTLSETIAGVETWLKGISRLALRLDRFHEEARFQSAERTRLKQRIEELEMRIAETADRKVQAQLRETLAGRRHQLRMIGELENLMERGELRLDHAVSALGTIYTQVTILAARGMDAGETARLAREISEETEQVDSVLTAMDRVYEPMADGILDVDGAPIVRADHRTRQS